jgi:hypothetical protein
VILSLHEWLLQPSGNRAHAARFFIFTSKRLSSNLEQGQHIRHSINELRLSIHGKRNHEASWHTSQVLS